MAAVVTPSPHQRGHGGSPGRVRADLAQVPLDEHTPMLLEVRGWRWIRRFRLVAATDAPGPEVREEPGYQAAIGTQCRDHGAWGAAAGHARGKISGT
jgi:hypothetical protein